MLANMHFCRPVVLDRYYSLGGLLLRSLLSAFRRELGQAIVLNGAIPRLSSGRLALALPHAQSFTNETAARALSYIPKHADNWL